MQATLAIGEKILYPTAGRESVPNFYVTNKRILCEKSGLMSRASTEIPLEQIGSIQIRHNREWLVSGIILLAVGAFLSLSSLPTYLNLIGPLFILIGIGAFIAGLLQKPTITLRATNGALISIQNANPESLKQTILDAKQLNESFAPSTVRETKETVITEVQVIYCKYCGTKNEIASNVQYCQKCGGKL